MERGHFVNGGIEKTRQTMSVIENWGENRQVEEEWRGWGQYRSEGWTGH